MLEFLLPFFLMYFYGSIIFVASVTMQTSQEFLIRLLQ